MLQIGAIKFKCCCHENAKDLLQNKSGKEKATALVLSKIFHLEGAKGIVKKFRKGEKCRT